MGNYNKCIDQKNIEINTTKILCCEMTHRKDKKNSAPSEDRTHDLQIALSFVIMRLTRYLLRYQGTHLPMS